MVVSTRKTPGVPPNNSLQVDVDREFAHRIPMEVKLIVLEVVEDLSKPDEHAAQLMAGICHATRTFWIATYFFSAIA